MRETTHARAARASAVRRDLRRVGISEGVRVEGSVLGATLVSVDLRSLSRRDALTRRVTEALEAAGYTVLADPERPWSLTARKG